MTDPRQIEHDALAKRQKPVSNAPRYILLAFIPFGWAVYLAYYAPDWMAIGLGAFTAMSVTLIGLDLAADKR